MVILNHSASVLEAPSCIRCGTSESLRLPLPVGAAARLRREGGIAPQDTAVCLLTASGLKNLDQLSVDSATSELRRGRLGPGIAVLSDRYGFSPT